MEPAHPQWYEIVTGSLAVIAGSFVAAAAVRRSRRGAPLSWIVAVGAALAVVGIAGQRTFPTADELHRLGAAAAESPPGPWEAGVSIPLVGLRLTPVTLAGLLLMLVGLAIVLLLEPVGGEEERPPPDGRAVDVEDGDSV